MTDPHAPQLLVGVRCQLFLEGKRRRLIEGEDQPREYHIRDGWPRALSAGFDLPPSCLNQNPEQLAELLADELAAALLAEFRENPDTLAQLASALYAADQEKTP